MHEPEHGRRIKQKRGKQTYDALIDSGFRLVEKQPLEEISVAELAKEAGYSVGAFYARFHSKDEFFDAMLAKHFEMRNQSLDKLFNTLPADQLCEAIVKNLVTYFWAHRRFWQTALLRSMRDAEFKKPLQQQAVRLTKRFMARLSENLGRELSSDEQKRIVTAFQVILGMVNHVMLEFPGPTHMNKRQLHEALVLSFKAVSDVDSMR